MTGLESQVAEALTRSEDELYLALGATLYGNSMLPPRPEELITLGKRWWIETRNELRARVCKSDHIKRLARQDVATHELVVAVTGVLDLSSHLLGVVPAVTVSDLTVRLALYTMC